MEVEFDSNAFLEEESLLDIPGDTDGGLFENERCGICMDVIVDRGVLDCCQHWFCFACIDNWATITNLCPLCENEFQLITCVPVYDTIGSGKAEDDSLVREEDWLVQGKNNTLSFPSYYIDENAVICLDGDGCKIRNGAASTFEDPNLDTSIACDSCDIWYHAFCVGFDPGSASENSWLCPRCVIEDFPPKSDGVPVQASKTCDVEIASRECLVGANFSGKFSVSVADAGETAVVVSVFQGQQCNDEHSENFTSVPDTDEVEKTERLLSDSSGFTMAQINWKIDHHSTLDAQDASLALSLSRDVPCSSLPLEELKATSDAALSCPHDPDGSKICDLTDKINTDNGTDNGEFKIELQMGLSMGSSLSVDMINSNATENHPSAVSEQIEDSLSVVKMAMDASGERTRFVGSKRKSTSPSVLPGIETLASECQTETPAKKARSDGIEPADFDTSDEDLLENEDVNSDIMSIVRGTCQRPASGMSRPSTADKSSQANDNGTRLRVKKIMRRGTEDESVKLVEKLREEIKEAVRNKSAKDIGKSNLFDPKLLTAFRAAVAGPRTEQLPIKRLNPRVVRSKKTLLQKGKIRENLTKKIYGINGKRRRAWDRDWEVEFWKHRCNNSARPEKVETLKSVLDLLRKNSESLQMEKETNHDGETTILSRLYLADASVFPRKDDIKPLSAISGHKNHELDKELSLNKETCEPVSDKSTTQTPAKSNQSCSKAYKVNKGDASSLKNEAAFRKVNTNESTRKQTSTSMPNGSKVNAKSNKESPGKSDVKNDKRKWALEVLARKNATAGMNSTKEKQEDNVMLKGNFPLLTQLPKDMRPVLAPSRHNKVPMSVRQTQLYRLTEHFLRKANVTVIRRTADTELAVADATNIEKEIADKSNSKLVYVNLCSQVVSQNSNKSKHSGDAKSNHSVSASASAGQEPHLDASGEEALRMAGLVDSPPGSPCHKAKGTGNDEVPSSMAEDDGPDNVFDMDNHPELDIYGDFEYDLDDECIDAGVLKLSKSQPEETDNKMKVIFSTLNATNMSSGPSELKDLKVLQIIESPTKPSCLELPNDKALEVRTDASSPGAEPLQGVMGEPSWAECEELYGPDKEPLVARFPDKIPGETDLLADRVPSAENGAPGENAAAMEMQGESCAENVFVNSRLPADRDSSGGEMSPNHSLTNSNNHGKEKRTSISKQSDISHSISKKVEAYVKEHIRPLCKSGVITPEQYRWAVGKTTEKVMRYHFKDKNANFLIKEGEKVKKLAEQYVEAAQQKQSKLP